jgi:hypothetical protein
VVEQGTHKPLVGSSTLPPGRGLTPYSYSTVLEAGTQGAVFVPSSRHLSSKHFTRSRSKIEDEIEDEGGPDGRRAFWRGMERVRRGTFKNVHTRKNLTYVGVSRESATYALAG